MKSAVKAGREGGGVKEKVLLARASCYPSFLGEPVRVSC